MAQRFPKHKLSAALDLMSFLTGKENLVGLERFFRGFERPSDASRALQFLSLEESFGTFQEQTLLRKLGIERKRGEEPADITQDLNSWIAAS